MNRLCPVVAAVLVLACGGTTPADPAAYQQTTQEALTQVETHRTNALAATTADGCMTEHSRYDAAVKSKIEMLKMQSGDMDRCMKQMSKPDDADVAATCDSMMSELESHRSAACAGATAANQAEATRHCDAMKTFLTRLKSRATYLASPMPGMSSSSCM